MTRSREHDGLRWAHAGRLAASEIASIQRRLLAAAAAGEAASSPLLVVAEVAEPAILFGRFRRIPVEFLEGVARDGWRTWRRMTGGRSVPCSPGDLHVSLILDESREPVAGPLVPLPREKILNRCVRGLLAGLRLAGVRPFYPGRDVVTAGGKRIASISFDAPDASGAVIFEAIVARNVSFSEGEEILGASGVRLPHGPGCPAAATSLRAETGKDAESADLVHAVVRGYAEASRLQAREAPEAIVEEDVSEGAWSDVEIGAWLAERDPSPLMTAHAAAEIPLGVLEVFAAAGAGDAPRLGAVRITGDFIADSPSILALERRLEGVPASWREIGLVTDTVLARPPAVLLGLGPLRTIPDTIVRALSSLDR